MHTWFSGSDVIVIHETNGVTIIIVTIKTIYHITAFSFKIPERMGLQMYVYYGIYSYLSDPIWFLLYRSNILV